MVTLSGSPETPDVGARRRGRPALPLASAAGLGLLVVAAAWALARGLGEGSRAWDGDYGDLPALAVGLVAAATEPQFYAVVSASACLLLGGAFAHLASRLGWSLQGFVQACGSGLWPWVVASAVLSMVLSHLLWGWTLAPGAWQPLFVPLVSVAPAMVVLYGPGRTVGLTAAVMGAVLAPPVSVVAVEYVCQPLGLPSVVGATTGMWVGASVAFLLSPLLPWMPVAGAWRTAGSRPVEVGGTDPATGRLWVVRRALADFSEAQFFGNEWASAAMILGALVAVTVSPSTLVYGTGLFASVLVAQALTALTGVIVWRGKWRSLGFYPTFVPVVSVAPASVLVFGGTAVSVVLGALAGALLAPPLGAAIAHRLPRSFHPFVGYVASMSISTAAIVPLLDLLPGTSS